MSHYLLTSLYNTNKNTSYNNANSNSCRSIKNPKAKDITKLPVENKRFGHTVCGFFDTRDLIGGENSREIDFCDVSELGYRRASGFLLYKTGARKILRAKCFLDSKEITNQNFCHHKTSYFVFTNMHTKYFCS